MAYNSTVVSLLFFFPSLNLNECKQLSYVTTDGHCCMKSLFGTTNKCVGKPKKNFTLVSLTKFQKKKRDNYEWNFFKNFMIKKFLE